MLYWLEQLDQAVFRAIHERLSLAAIDPLMLLLREAFTWIPLYVFLLVWARKRTGASFGWFVLLSVACVAITDFTSSSIFKPFFGRVRPCYDPALQPVIRGLISCGGLYSLPSSHAANHVGLAVFWYGSIRLATGQKWGWLWGWAFLVGYAQVYVGKHFPLDILAGALLGLWAGYGCLAVFKWLYLRQQSAVVQPRAQRSQPEANERDAPKI